MDEVSFRALREDIETHGQLVPIWLHHGRIIDGRNRYRVCLELGIEPIFREWDRQGELVDFVVALNLRRRHLTTTQRAVVAFKMLPVIEAQAKERQMRRAGSVPEILPEQKGDARDQAAALVGVSGRYVSEVKKIVMEAPEFLQAMETGALTLQGAKRQISKENPTSASSKPENVGVMILAAEAISRLAKISETDPQFLPYMERVRVYLEGRIRHAEGLLKRKSLPLAAENQLPLFDDPAHEERSGGME